MKGSKIYINARPHSRRLIRKHSWAHVCPGSRNCASRLRSQQLKLAPHAPSALLPSALRSAYSLGGFELNENAIDAPQGDRPVERTKAEDATGAKRGGAQNKKKRAKLGERGPIDRKRVARNHPKLSRPREFLPISGAHFKPMSRPILVVFLAKNGPKKVQPEC